MDDIPPEILDLAELFGDRPEFRKGAVYLSRAVEPVIDGLWLVRDWIPRLGLSVIWGPSGAGKSHLAADMACHVARGETWSGNPVEHGLVVYVALEGHGRIAESPGERGDAVSDAAAARDAIFDFDAASDTIDLSAIDADSGLAGDQAFVWVTGLTGVAGELFYDASTHVLDGDFDGDGVADLSISVSVALVDLHASLLL